MKYVVVYDLGTIKSAFCFDDRDDAISYIDACSDYAGDHMNEMASINEDLYEMTLQNGKTLKISIEEYPDNKVRFDLSYDKNGRHIETRRFSKRSLAVNFAKKTLDELDCFADEGENEAGEWIVDDPETNTRARLGLSLVVVGDKETSDYDILGVKSTATSDEIKRAYRQMAIKNHPDKGGDPKKFQAIHDAYERITAGKSKKTSQSVLKSFANMDMRYFFKNFDNIVGQGATIPEAELEPLLAQVRSKAVNLIIYGILEMIVGGGLTATSYSNASSTGGTYTIFWGLVIVGIWSFIRGIYYCCNPKAMLKKVLKK